MRRWILASFVVACCVISAPAEGQVVDWVSIGVGGADGRFVVFESWADNLVGDDFNGDVDVFRRDRQTGTTTRVSVSSTGGDALGASENPSISATGHYVAFASTAGNLVSGDGNSDWDVFVRDMDAGSTERVSVSFMGGDPDGPCNRPSISADGGRGNGARHSIM